MAVSVNRPVRLTAVAALSAVVLLLTGCSGDAGGDGPTSAASETTTSPAASETPGGDSGSPSASPSSSATGSYEPATSEGPAKNVPVPEMPEAVKEPTEEGLEAAVEYWWEAGYYLQLTGDPGPLESISSEECVICESFVENWREVYDAGGWSTGSTIDIENLVVDVQGDGAGSMIMLINETKPSIHESNGEERTGDTAGQEVDVHWTGYASFDESDGHWIVEELVVQSSGGDNG